MPIKIFNVNEKPDVIEKIINDWEEQNNYKIDNVSVSPLKWYMNNNLTNVMEMEYIIVVNYHNKKSKLK